MITPENNLPFDDAQNEEADDQQSQKDIHSNGLDSTIENTNEEEEPSIDLLKQAYDAAESSYTLNLDDEPKTDDN